MKNLKILFWITIFMNSFLLFLIEPMFSRYIVPTVGGSISVWNIALMCFQVLLLCGYLYTHYFPKLVGYNKYMLIHICVLVLSAITSCILFKIKSFDINTSAPTIDLILILLSTISIPFFMLSTSSTNFQHYYSLTQKEMPYHLYALSNAANLIALVSYPLFLEVFIGLKKQILLWNILYSTAVIIGVFICVKVYLKLKKYDFSEIKDSNKQNKEKISKKRKIYWLLLSFIPCGLMIAQNNVLENRVNVASIHYYWILPLIIYLLSYIIAFSNIRLFSVKVFEKIALWLSIVVLAIFFTGMNQQIYILSMLLLFVISFICNMYIVADEPDISNLTEFYLWIAIGGALAGVVCSIIAPLIFNNVYEYPLIVIGFLLLMFHLHKKSTESFVVEQWEYTFLFVVGLLIVLSMGMSQKSLIYICLLLLAFVIRKLYSKEKTRIVSLATIIILTSSFNYVILQNIDYQVRNFYGIKTIITSDYIDNDGTKHKLVNMYVGNTLHGSQFASGDEYEFEALTYYDKEGSTVGRFFTGNKDRIKTVGAVGLGVGILSTVSDEHQKWKYFEIDPQVLEIANNKKYFTILDKYKHEVVTGDARIKLQSEKDNYYDVLVLDAYSGDIVPASLLTKEAIELYKSKLKDDGIMLFHITNHQFDLRPVLSTVADVIDMECYIDTIPSKGIVIPANSVWVMMTNNKSFVSENWTKIEKYDNFQLWTDDKYSIATVLKK